MFVQMCCAVETCFMKCIVHRDIKPQNILLSKVNGVTILKLADFGLAKLVPNLHDYGFSIAGSNLFMAPEVKQG